MVNRRSFAAVGGFLQLLQLFRDLGLDLIVVLDIVQRFLLFDGDTELQRTVQIVQQLVDSSGIHCKVAGNVTAEHSSLDTLNVTANVSL